MTEYKTIAESNNFIMLENYSREWMVTAIAPRNHDVCDCEGASLARAWEGIAVA